MDEREEREICARIKQARKEAGLTQDQMAGLLHVEKRTYQNYEDYRVPFRRLDEIATITGKPREWLLYGDGPNFFARIERMESRLADMNDKLGRLLDQMGATAVAEAVRDAGEATEPPAAGSPPKRAPKGKRKQRGS